MLQVAKSIATGSPPPDSASEASRAFSAPYAMPSSVTVASVRCAVPPSSSKQRPCFASRSKARFPAIR
ncbi:hypothetical protein GA0115255_105698 [Streptomyces sp. Ncost-T6T-2b]|nr:hypothetical protein GA0115255_105698 [Streptomyces sp. Ncost-T6T-2b]